MNHSEDPSQVPSHLLLKTLNSDLKMAMKQTDLISTRDWLNQALICAAELLRRVEL